MNRDVYWIRFYKRVRQTNKRYFFEKFSDEDLSMRTIFNLFAWIKNDLFYIFKYIYYVPLNIRKFGKVIRSVYNLSYFQQWKRYTILMLILRAYPNHFRTRSLYKTENWNKVKDYIFTQSYVQLHLANVSFNEEIQIIENKFEFYKYCTSAGIQSPEVLVVFKNGTAIFDNNLESYLKKDLFLKSCTGGKGKGAKKFKYMDGHYLDNSGHSYAPDELLNYVKSVSKEMGAIIIQPALKNHASWINFTSGSLASCRIVTARHPDSDEIVPLFCCFKMPVKKLDVDNFMGGAIITPIHNMETGRLGKGISYHPIDGKFEHTEHPDTKYPIEGSCLSHWQELLDFTLQSHQHFKTIFVGWDVSQTTEGPCLLEGNITWSSGSYEIPFQDSLKNTIYPELYEKWWEKIISA
ncbi:MAG: sugar-transfer associated ATP-grasp domain-containing protein [Balneolaceae bacterium]|nr:sugar-transfer associated ATP-grasp domain-containing protein [Balneolaceae bacterium]